MDYEKKYKEANNKVVARFGINVAKEIFTDLYESEDERIRKEIIYHIQNCDDTINEETEKRMLAWLEKQPTNIKETEQEKRDFVGDGFLKCRANYQDFKEGEHYWLEYVGDDDYNVRSDNLLGKTYHITPLYLYTVFAKLTWLKKQGKSDKIVEKAKTEKQRVLVTESDGSANIDWDTRSLEDARKLLEYGLQYINTELEKQGGQKSAEWSEEDETNSYHLKTLLENLAKDIKHEFRVISYNDRDKYTTWLESLKDRVQPQTSWKPTVSQMSQLKWIAHQNADNMIGKELMTLYEDLKKLTE